MSEKRGFDTLALHGGQKADIATGACAVPIYQTTAYLFEDSEHAAELFALNQPGNIYTRIQNPTWAALEERITALEGGAAALATASGQAAETIAILNIAAAGDHIVAAESLYGGSVNLLGHTLGKLGIETTFVDPDNPENFEQAITDKTKLIFAETMGNPKGNMLDIRPVADIAHAAGIPLIIDNTVTTPYLCRPISHGADIVIHSMTKFLGGHGTSIGGMIVDSGNFDWTGGKFPELTEPDPSYHGMIHSEHFGKLAYISKARVQLLRDIGAALSPFNAFLILQGVETLSLRMQRHCDNALAVAEHLQNHPRVEWVCYAGLENHPSHKLAEDYLEHGFGAILGFGIKGGYDAGKRFIDNVRLLSHVANIGDAKSLVIHPASTTHQQLDEKQRQAAGVTAEFIRLSVGLETLEDIIADIDNALLAACS